jgi:hypothetical protein
MPPARPTEPCSAAAGSSGRRQWRHHRPPAVPAPAPPLLRRAVHRGPRPSAPARPVQWTGSMPPCAPPPVHHGPVDRPPFPRSTAPPWTGPTAGRHVARMATAPARPCRFAKRPLPFFKINPRPG